MFQSAKDRYTEFFRFEEDENGNMLKDKKGMYKFKSCGTKKNPAFIPGAKRKRPKWCIKRYGKDPSDSTDMTPRPDCDFPRCPYLAHSEVDRAEYEVMLEAWEKAGKEGKFKHLEGDDEPIKAPQSKKKTSHGKRDVASPKGRGT
jgi:hypothetical protein